jgi:tellurite resistance protein TerC
MSAYYEFNPILPVVFTVIISVMLLFDLGVFHRKQKTIPFKEALQWTTVWIGLSMLFSLIILLTTYSEEGFEKFSQYQSAYWIEKMLSLDNIFVFILLFREFNVSAQYRHKILMWGIIGAIVLRAVFIFAGVEIVKISYINALTLGNFSFTIDPEIENTNPLLSGKFHQINPLLFLFGVFLFYMGIKTANDKKTMDENNQINNNRFILKVKKLLKIEDTEESGQFWIWRGGHIRFTHLFFVLVCIEFTDILFAMDSIPAIFSIAPNDPFILYSSNIFAILGLRSLFFVLDNYIDQVKMLKKGISILLMFIGIKMIIGPVYHISGTISFLVIVSTMFISILITFLKERRI